MRRSLVLRRATLTDLTPDDLAVVGGGDDASLLCSADCFAIREPSEILAGIVVTVCACPWTAGC